MKTALLAVTAFSVAFALLARRETWLLRTAIHSAVEEGMLA